ncbi:glycosyl transferase group 1 [Thioalkalivibrio sp. K90mix]|uniref:tRNA-queuosine alpha-mannosyltransferase domain-containing protein n=1 Tax=Thioalkalivibrio sp. (strain K90mix) TaxID=396595 RepID=UPI000195A7F7|nr:DUF3524 domain-containing protein [Thioalkalivibrio sp. K90mix]ADC71031.1 glycosyl transferase group 1 [Thioalkalivibrio sp. K90mix]
MQPAAPRILLLSAYRADSHAAWADWLTRQFSEFDWERRELPGRHFRWRIRGNPISWLETLGDAHPDAIMATSMVDLATLRGLHPALAQTPALYYFHENQFAYPTQAGQNPSVDPQMVQLYGALAADRIAFNSRYNRDTFLDGVDRLLARMPDQVPPGVRTTLAERGEILPVPIQAITSTDHTERDPNLILWNHRWEYDKAPDDFAEAMLQLARKGIDFRLALLGPRPVSPPESLARLRADLADRIVVDTKCSREEYEEWLCRAGIVVSTARHEFQGLSLLEAARAGVLPLVPDALVYPEQYPTSCRYATGDTESLAARLGAWLSGERPPVPDIGDWHAGRLEPQWRRQIEDLLETRRGVD